MTWIIFSHQVSLNMSGFSVSSVKRRHSSYSSFPIRKPSDVSQTVGGGGWGGGGGGLHKKCKWKSWMTNEWMTHFPLSPGWVRVPWLSLYLQHNVVWFHLHPLSLCMMIERIMERETPVIRTDFRDRKWICDRIYSSHLCFVSLENPGLSPQFNCCCELILHRVPMANNLCCFSAYLSNFITKYSNYHRCLFLLEK